ncbi:MAG TPA: hypothetical protein VLT33_09220, partial [Labilithrix sp.]|nr:hypothetical protein [Labilithrix sp.]
DLAHIVVRSLRREPADRFQTAQELEQALVGWAASRQVDLDIGRSTLLQHATPSAFELPGVADTRRQDLELIEASRSRRRLTMTALGIGALGILTVALAVRLSGPRSVVPEVRTVLASPPSSPVLPAVASPLPASLAVPSGAVATPPAVLASSEIPPARRALAPHAPPLPVAQSAVASAVPVPVPAPLPSPTPSAALDGRIFRRTF